MGGGGGVEVCVCVGGGGGAGGLVGELERNGYQFLHDVFCRV